jgi:hypothetical protein
MTDQELVGREPELAELDRFVDFVGSGFERSSGPF